MTKEQWGNLSLEEKTKEAKRMSQKEWDKLFPSKKIQREPADASGFTEDMNITLIS